MYLAAKWTICDMEDSSDALLNKNKPIQSWVGSPPGEL